ncbi:MAG: hypothetical protein ACRCZI_05805 [Cetobacterium sp.]
MLSLLLGLFGSKNSKQDILNKTLNDVAIKVITDANTSVGSSIKGSNDIKTTNSAFTWLTNINQTTKSKLSATAIMQSVSENKLQADLVNALKNEVHKESPFLGLGEKTDQEVKNIIENNIRSTITFQNLIKI